MKTSNQGFVVVAALVLLAVVVLGGGAYVYIKESPSALPADVEYVQLPQSDTSVDTEPVAPSASPLVNTVKIIDKSNLYSIEIPKDWKVTSDEGPKGVQLSSISGESSAWKVRVDDAAEGPCSPSYYESGIHFQFHSVNAEDDGAHYGEGGGPETGVISKKNILIDDTNAVYHVFKEPCTAEGQLVDAHVNYGGVGYRFTFIYNPAKDPQAEELFTEILNSVEFEG